MLSLSDLVTVKLRSCPKLPIAYFEVLWLNVEGSNRWQIIALERSKLTAELTWNSKFSQKTN